MDSLVPVRLRGPVVVVASLCTVIAAGLGACFYEESSPSRIDRLAADWIHGTFGQHGGLMEHVIRLGDPLPTVEVILGLALGGVLLGRWRMALLAVVGPSTAILVTEFVFKPIVGRTRGGALSFPSGHITGVTAVAAVVVVLLLGGTRLKSVVVKVLLVAGVLTVSAAVAVALVAQNWHYATDIVGGVCVAVGAVLGVALVVDGLGADPGTGEPHRERELSDVGAGL